jgi:hypothetical protein
MPTCLVCWPAGDLDGLLNPDEGLAMGYGPVQQVARCILAA